jgi:hypothetical protein
MLSNIPKNIHRSMFEFINSGYTETEVFLEGDTQRDQTIPFIEVRMDGPKVKHLSGGEVYCTFECNILIQVSIANNLYTISDICGTLLELLANGFNILDQNGTVLGCARVDKERRRGMEINRYGLIDPQSELMQATVEIGFDVTLEV